MQTRVAKEVVAGNGHITISIGEILDMREPLKTLMQRPLPARASFRLAQLGGFLNPHLLAFEEARMKLIRELGENIENTREYKVTEANMDAFNEQMATLRQEEVSVPAITINLPTTLEIEAMILFALASFVGVDEEQS